MKRFSLELIVGIFLIIGFLAFIYLAVKLGEVDILRTGDYSINARFTSVTGLKTDAIVEIAGVQIGKVKRIRLDDDRAVVELRIYSGAKLPDDSVASIRTMGIIGDKYIKISLGGSDRYIQPGGMITETESAIDLEELVSKYIFGKI
ncbi:MAG: outer membrane lipid asymmetry maintenance protein MlaD [Deltaproteobacteria bacterium]|nr:outer membrane lipid asymmetry maintenance protein MlaD [Deltaproteobacteria bacterium]MBW2306668.1 outer membrane lipid asymmetry maintenance protein MlaD [Deltaproteobacteria bacterium]